MIEQNETPRYVLPTAVAVEVAAPSMTAVPIAADRLYQLAALTAGFFLLATLL